MSREGIVGAEGGGKRLATTLRRRAQAVGGLEVDGDELAHAALVFGPDLVFHSIRSTLAALLQNAGVGENVAADILGHEKPWITYGLDSRIALFTVKHEAIEKLAYPRL